MSQFSDAKFADGCELVLGQVTGIRDFGVTEAGELTGIYYEQVFGLVSHAMCLRLKSVPREDITDAEREHMLTLPYSEDLTRTKTRKADPCSGVEKDCDCGFWAYWDGVPRHAGSKTVTGIIHGQGRTQVGTRGFRCARAVLVAIVLPAPNDRSIDPHRNRQLPSLLAADVAELVALRYAVPTYESVAAMLAKHPTSQAQDFGYGAAS